MTDAIKLKGVAFSYGKTPILSDVSLSIGKGEFVGMIGPNGGGKTTLLKLMMGLLEPDAGIITLAPPAQIGYVPQRLPFDRHFPLSTLELVLSGTLATSPWIGRYTRRSKEAALHALEHVDLVPDAHTRAGSLSGGQLQRALIARALVSNPQILCLDEPTANIDAQAEEHLHALLAQLKGKMTIVMVTHDLGAAIHQFERVLCVQRNVFPLKPDEVCEHFSLGLYHKPLLKLGDTE